MREDQVRKFMISILITLLGMCTILILVLFLLKAGYLDWIREIIEWIYSII